MRFNLLARKARPTLAALAMVAAVVGCNADGATGPAGVTSAPTLPAISYEVVSPDVTSPVLNRKHKLAKDRTISLPVDQNGGLFQIPGSGLYIWVPPGAVDGPITLTATALPGRMMAYEFGPHGTHFNVPLQMYQDLGDAQLAPGLDLSKFEVGYFTDKAKLNTQTDQASISEFIPTSIEFSGQFVRFEVSHFSGYVIATGRGGAN
jgi:hypothetical protein